MLGRKNWYKKRNKGCRFMHHCKKAAITGKSLGGNASLAFRKQRTLKKTEGGSNAE